MVYVGSSWVELDYWTSPSWGDYDARLRVLAYSTQDVASNSSTVYFKLQKRVTGGSAFNNDPLDFAITCKGAKNDSHSATQEWTFGSVSDTSWQDVPRGGDMWWGTVRHRDDGSLSLTATASGDRILGGSFNTDITLSFPTIPRASVASGSPNPLTIGSSGATLTVNTNRKSSSFTHYIRVNCGSFRRNIENVGASTNVSIPYEVLAQFSATSKTKTADILCWTYSGSTQIGSQQNSTVTFQIDDSTDHPIIASVIIQDTNQRTSAITQSNDIMIANISTLKATIYVDVVGDYTELSYVNVRCGSKTQRFNISGTSQTVVFEFDKVNADNMDIVVVDKRGNSRGRKETWTLIPYQALTATATVSRPSATGSVGVGQLTGMAYGGNFGGKNLLQNAITMYGWGAGSGANITGGVATLNGTTSNWNASLRTPKYPASLYDGSTTYTLSYDYKSTASCSIQVTIAGSDKAVSDPAVNRTKYVGWGTETVPSSGGTWARRTLSSRTIAVSQLTSGSGEVVSGFLQFYARTDNVQFQIRNVQLEKGSPATAFSSSENVLTVAVDFKKHDDSDYDPQGTETYTLALPTSGYNPYTDSFTFQYQMDYQYQYDIKFTVSDLFSTATYVAQMMQGLPIISWDENEVDVFGDLHIHDRQNPYSYQNVIDGFDAILDSGGEKNFFARSPETRTNAGVTFTPLNDGGITVVGTASQESWSSASSAQLPAGEYILSGSRDGVATEVWDSAGTTLIARSYNGEEAHFTVSSLATYWFYCEVPSGGTVNTTVYPMVRDARIASDTFNPNKYGIQVYEERGSWSGSNSVIRNFKITGKGFVIMDTWVRAQDGITDTGTCTAWIDIRTASAFVTTLQQNLNRLSASSTYPIRISAHGFYYYNGTSDANRIRAYLDCSKNGNNTWQMRITCIGCTVQKI